MFGAAERAKQQQDSDYWQHLRATFFEPVSITIGGRRRKMPRVHAYHHTLQSRAAQGDVSAISELRHLAEKLENDGILERAGADPADNPVAVAEEKHAAMLEAVSPVILMLAYAMQEDFRSHVESCVPGVSVEEYTWPGWKIYLTDTAVERVERALAGARRRADAEPGVGYRSPPSRTQFQPGQSGNPAGKQPRSDAFDVVRAGLTALVSVKAPDGGTKKLTISAIGCIKLFEQAMGGKRGAQRELRKIAYELERRGLLKLPAPRRRRPRRSKLQKEKDLLLMQMYARVLMPIVKRDLMQAYTDRYGPLKPLTTSLERRLGPLETSPVFATLAPGLQNLCRTIESLNDGRWAYRPREPDENVEAARAEPDDFTLEEQEAAGEERDASADLEVVSAPRPVKVKRSRTRTRKIAR
ncbi:DUF5681 domain-containing protein [Enterovirga sp. CN4-39]|uniref:DUF5681 domain-containing protein n=1 Tax=Enterovirga sp. CN4-39 TaxID=3400910 RepID=UPI003C0DD838